ncbi:unnamed protein product [Mytilus edulis]|uniref:Ig-like domain-containing protein n=1 Tax=Mytilus edulis TaxID=6550 RepID=A0A8S3R2T9_MYTED|nr:unnamed protein product [Mytilus edulis]
MHLTIPVLVLLVDLSFEKEYLSWKLLTNKVVFGQTIQLMCHLPKQNCCHNFTRSWEGGPDYKPLTLNEKSSNYTKYIEHLDTETGNSILTIKSFSESDVDILYQCSYRFSSYAAVLQLTKHRYEYHPTESVPVSLSSNGTHMYAKISLEKVFPKPQCYGYANEKDITQESLKVISKRNGIFYKSMIGFNYMIDPQQCSGLVTITCIIGISRIIIAEQSFSCQKTGSKFQGKHLAQRDFVTSNSYNEESNIVVNVLIILCVHFIK